MDDRLLFDSRLSMLNIIAEGETTGSTINLPNGWFIVRVFDKLNGNIVPITYYIKGNVMTVSSSGTTYWRAYGKS